VPGPKFRGPYAAALLAAYGDEAVSAITGKPPKAPLAGVRMARYKMFFNPAKAIGELGLPQTPLRQAFAEAVEWFRKNGYVTSRRWNSREEAHRERAETTERTLWKRPRMARITRIKTLFRPGVRPHKYSG